MENLNQLIMDAVPANAYFCVLSNPVKKEEPYSRIEFSLLDGAYVVKKYTQTQVFHAHLAYDEMLAFITERLGSSYRNLNAWDGAYEYAIRLSKKGKPLTSRHAMTKSAPKPQIAHNRVKKSIIPEDTFIEPLYDMGVLTKEGKIIKKMYGKFRQINRFIEIIDDALNHYPKETLHILDFGCGKSYLTFLLYYYFTQVRKIKVTMTGLDLKAEVIEKCNASAHRYGYTDLHFEVGDIGKYEYHGPLDMVISLHACDTATDYALLNAIKWNAQMIFAVPCCQHELNLQMKSERLSLMTDYGIIKERFAALSTDAIRGNLLKYSGYKVQILEFIEMDHTPKNLMIRAIKAKVDREGRAGALAEAEAMMEEFGFAPTLYALLEEAGYMEAPGDGGTDR